MIKRAFGFKARLLWALFALLLEVSSAQVLLGSLTTRAHGVSGDVWLLGDRILEVRNFVYDGLGPAAVFWFDTSSTPTSNGTPGADGSPSNGCDLGVPLLAASATTQRVELPAGVNINDFLGGSFSVWCQLASANFGELILPTSVDIPDNAPLLECFSNTNTSPPVFVGSINTREHSVSGDLWLLSDRILEVRNFVYDGQGPAALFWFDTSSVPSSGGIVAADGFPSNGCSTTTDGTALKPSNGSTQRIELPSGVTINDFLSGSFSVYCTRFNVNFGEVIIPSTLQIPETGPSFDCFTNTETSEAVFLSSFTTRSHQVAGDLWLLSDRVLEIRNYVYDGLGPAGYFWIDASPTPTRQGQVAADASPSGGCATSTDDSPLRAADGITQRVELPDGTTINDFLGGSLSIWCERFAVNFGEAIIPSTVMVPSTGTELGCFRSSPPNAPIFLSSFTTRQHQVAGDFYLVSDRVLQIRNFVYDGQGPAGYFWIDGSPTPTGDGRVVSDGYPSLGCAMDTEGAVLPAADGITQYIELPPGMSIQDYAGGSISVWCERFSVNFGEAVIPASVPFPPNDDKFDCFGDDMEVAPIAVTPDGYNCEPLNDQYQVRWQIAGDRMNVELLGRIEKETYMGFGISGRPETQTWMIGADAVVADITESGARVRDIFMDSRAQCSGSSGVCPDSIAGFSNDVSNVSSEEDFGLTLIRYSRPLVPSDEGLVTSLGQAVDRSIPTGAGVNTYIVWAIGPISNAGNPLFHSVDFATRDGNDASLEFGRAIADNCPPLAFTAGTSAPTASPPPPFRRPVIGDSDGTTTFDLHIGPSGGPRGYAAITGEASWGIAWYVNGILIPKLTLRRGVEYTFRISGGNNPADDANHHPFYLTDSKVGGYKQLTPAERLDETTFAGIEITDADAAGVYEYEAPLVAPICRYETTAATAGAELGEYEDYFATLDTSCASDPSITDQAAILKFTPDETTPDTIYYHCVTHFNLGFEIEVIDATSTPGEAPGVSVGFTEVRLTGPLQGGTLSYKVNVGDPNAGGVDTLTVVLEAPVVGWVGFAFNDGSRFMVGSEAVIGLPDSGEVKKYNLNQQSVGGVVPMTDDKQTLLDTSITQTSSSTILSFTKILVEEGEIPINGNGMNVFLSAWGSGNQLAYHAARGPFNLNLAGGEMGGTGNGGAGNMGTMEGNMDDGEDDDEDVDEDVAWPPAIPGEAPDVSVGFTEVALTGRLQGGTLNYKVNAGDPNAGGVDTLTVVLEAPVVGWVGFAFNDGSRSMIGSEAVIGLPDSGKVEKYSLNQQSTNGVVRMADDKQTLLDTSITQTSSSTILGFTKILVEEGEIPVDGNGMNTFLSAWGSGNQLGFHATRGSYDLDFAGGGMGEAENGEEENMGTTEGVFLSSFTTRFHQVAGDLWLLSDRVLEIRNYVYDGQGPAAFFWIDASPTPTRQGQVAADASPSGGCAMNSEDSPLPAANGITQRVELPDGTTINDFLGGSLSIWCELASANFGEAIIPATVMVPSTGTELECFRSSPPNAPIFLSSFTTRQHQVAGDLYLVSDRVLQIRNFVYDGQGPAGYFWIDVSPTPTGDGRVVSDGYPSLGCAMDTEGAVLPAADGITQYIELPPGMSIQDYAGGSISVWCERFSVNFGEAVIPASVPFPPNDDKFDCFGDDMEVAPIAVTPDGYNCEPLNDQYQVRWQIAGDRMNVELLGRIEKETYMGFGISGRPETQTWMIGADAVVADITESGARVRDIFMDSRAQCSGSSGVCTDTDGGFTNDVSNVSSEEDFGLTLIRYSRPLVPSDELLMTSLGESVDRSIPTGAGVNTYIVWAIGPISNVGNPLFHSVDYAGRDGNDASLEFGRAIADNCPPLAFTAGTSAPTASPPPPFRRPLVGDSDGSLTFDLHIGPSGGPRGYAAITGEASWGIAWYVNGILIPKLTLRRGVEYTFRISGGNNPADDANHHPFYLTDSKVGGYKQLTPAERLDETTFAGIEITDADAAGVYEYEAPLVAPICRYETTAATAGAELGEYEDYFATLDTSCASDPSITDQAAILKFTPDETTPDTIYYHCVTHFNLGFEIEVIDADAEKVTLSPTSAPGEAPDVSVGFTEVRLTGRLQGSTLNYKVNVGDPNAGGVDTLTVVLEAPVVGWVGFAFNDGSSLMVGSEAVIGLPDSGEVKKYNLNERTVGGVVLMADDKQTLLDTSITQTSSSTILSFTKILVEEGEIPINGNGMNVFLSAWGSGNLLGFHAQREAFSLDLAGGGIGELENPRNAAMWKAHGILAALAWAVLTPLAISASMVRNCLPDGLWFQIHRAFNMLSVTLTIIAFSIAVASLNQENPNNDAGHFDWAFADGHRTIGLVIFIFAIIQVVGGLLRPHLPPKLSVEEKSTTRKIWEIGHRVFGGGLVGLCWYQVQLGISTYHEIWGTEDQPTLIAFWIIVIGISSFAIVGFLFTFRN